VGYSGNLVGAVWLGNDDYSPTNNMTGGSLPAMVWHEVMSYAHQGLDIKPIPGLPPLDAPPGAPVVARSRPAGFEIVNPIRPSVLSKRSSEVLMALDDQFRSIEPQKVGDQGRRVEVLTPSGEAYAARGAIAVVRP